jgi:hypothetical protein
MMKLMFNLLLGTLCPTAREPKIRGTVDARGV